MAFNVQGYIHSTYNPISFYPSNALDDHGVTDERLQSIVDKINTFPSKASRLPVQPITLNNQEKAWLNPPDNTACVLKRAIK